MPASVEFVASYRVDVAGYTDSTFTLEQQEARKRAFFTSLEDCPTYQRMKGSLYLQNVGDGVYLVGNSTYAKQFLEIAKELDQNLRKNNDALQKSELHVKVRTGIHVGQAFVSTVDGKVSDISGNAMSYSERIMSLGEPGDILVTASAANTILALDSNYAGYLHYAGKYAIKHGDTLQVWYFCDTNSGNPRPPARKKEPLLLKMSSRNLKLGISLVALSVVALILSSQFLLADITSSSKDTRIALIKSSIEDEVGRLWIIQDHAKEPIQDELGRPADTMAAGPQATVIDLLADQTVRKNVITVLDLLHSSNADIKYAWVAAPATARCGIILYEPYGTIYDPTQDFTKRDWCLPMRDRTDYFTVTIFATGPDEFVNVMATRLIINDGSSERTVGYFGMGIHWNNLIPRMLSQTYGEGANVRLILEDHGGHISADCTTQGCLDLTEFAISRAGIIDPDPEDYVNMTEALKIDPAEYSQLPLESISLDELDVPSARPQILAGWKIHLYYPQEPRGFNPISTGLFGISLASLCILVYYYVIPRYWLDDTDRPGTKVKYFYQ